MHTKFFFAILLLFLPLTGIAKGGGEPGTDGYLRSIGYTDEQLSAGVVTEKREAFGILEGEADAEDPSGDVLNRFGATAEIQVPWADLVGASLEKDRDGWTVTFELAEPVADEPSGKANVIFYVDSDADTSNNDADGIKGGADREFSIEYNQENGWYTDYRWYNAPEDFWAMNLETTMVPSVNDTDVTFTVPFSELPEDVIPRWRAVTAVSQGDKTQIDVAPGVGFPPPIGETYPTDGFEETPAERSNVWVLVGTAATASIIVGLIIADRRKKQS
jgi:hypothetical protein